MTRTRGWHSAARAELAGTVKDNARAVAARMEARIDRSPAWFGGARPIDPAASRERGAGPSSRPQHPRRGEEGARRTSLRALIRFARLRGTEGASLLSLVLAEARV